MPVLSPTTNYRNMLKANWDRPIERCFGAQATQFPNWERMELDHETLVSHPQVDAWDQVGQSIQLQMSLLIAVGLDHMTFKRSLPPQTILIPSGFCCPFGSFEATPKSSIPCSSVHALRQSCLTGYRAACSISTTISTICKSYNAQILHPISLVLCKK